MSATSFLILFTALAYGGMLLQVVYHIGECDPYFTVMGLDRKGCLISKGMKVYHGPGFVLVFLNVNFQKG